MTAPLGATAPYWRRVPSGSRTAGPKAISPVAESRVMCRSYEVDAAKDATTSQSVQPSCSAVWRRTGGVSPTTGKWASRSRCPGRPVDSPSASSYTVSACTTVVVPPMVKASAARTVGEVV